MCRVDGRVGNLAGLLLTIRGRTAHVCEERRSTCRAGCESIMVALVGNDTDANNQLWGFMGAQLRDGCSKSHSR